jgi:hypothetical protein
MPLGLIYNTDEHNIKSVYYVTSKNKLVIMNHDFVKTIHTSEIKKYVKLCDKYIWVTESGSVYITDRPMSVDVEPAHTR